MAFKAFTMQQMGLGVFRYFFNIKLAKLSRKGNCSGRKVSKICITDIEAANVVSDKLPNFFIEKLNKPRCSKNIESPPFPYRYQQDGQMDAILIEKWASKRSCCFSFEQFPYPSSY